MTPKIKYKYKNVNETDNTIIWTKYSVEDGEDVEAQSDNELLKAYDLYELSIEPSWESELGGKPVAILVSASHTKDYTDINGETFTYEEVWANYSEIKNNGYNETTGFQGISPINYDIYFFPDSNDNKWSLKYAVVTDYYPEEDNKIKIPIARKYTGIIEFTVTPIMSYGKLTDKKQVFLVNQSKIASGEILVNTWNYSVIESEVTVANDSGLSKTVTTETTITETATPTSSGAMSLSKTIITETKTLDLDDTTDKIYLLSLKYGFESYKFDEQEVVNAENNYIKFYDLSVLPHYNKEKTPLNIIDEILGNSGITADYTYHIPTTLLQGGSLTINLTLNSIKCKLSPFKVYLCVFNIETYIVDKLVEFLTRDYRYLYTTSIYNSYVDAVLDYKNLYLPIVPLMLLTFGKDHLKNEYLLNGSESATIEQIYNDWQWVKKNSKPVERDFRYKCTVNNRPDELTFLYSDKAFYVEYSCGYDANYELKLSETANYNKISGSKEALLISPNNLCKISNGDDLEAEGRDNKTSVFSIDCKVDINYRVFNENGNNDTLDAYAIKCNLLNAPEKTGTEIVKTCVYLPEANGLNNTMMVEEGKLVSLGVTNDTGEGGAWYAEGTFLNEGYTTLTATAYNNSAKSNDEYVVDMDSYYDNSIATYYYLFYGSDKHSISVSDGKDPRDLRLSECLDMESMRNKFDIDFNHLCCAPMIFVTKGQASDDDKDDSISISVNIGSSWGSSQVCRENDDDAHGFDLDEPYLYPSWTGVAARGLDRILGTFLIQYATRNGAQSYVPTNNYFVSVFNEGKPKTYYIDDEKYLISDWVRNKYNNNYHWYYKSLDSFYKSCITSPDQTHVINYDLIPHINGSVTFGNSDVGYVNKDPYKYFTIGDLYATLLAQFGITIPYTNPISFALSSRWSKPTDDDIEELKTAKVNKINSNRVYSFSYNKNNRTVIDAIAQQLVCNQVNLFNWNLILPSNNLLFDPEAMHKLEITQEIDTTNSIIKELEYEKEYLSYELNNLDKDSNEYDSVNKKYVEVSNALDQNDYYLSLKEKVETLTKNLDDLTNYPTVTVYDDIEIQPLNSLFPDFDNLKYMVEITPFGDTNIDLLPESLNYNTLLYWDHDKKAYEEYKPGMTNANLYKYGKFLSIVSLSTSTQNSSNHIVLGVDDELLDGIICFAPAEETKTFTVSSPLHFNLVDGLFTRKKQSNETTSAKYCKGWRTWASLRMYGLPAPPTYDVNTKTFNETDDTMRL